jgi:hypothetical protein
LVVASQQFSPFFQGKNTTLIFTAPLLAVATEIEKEGDRSRKLHWGNLDEVYRLKSNGSPKEDALPSLKWSSSCLIYCTFLAHIRGPGNESKRDNLCFLSPCYFPKH